MMERWDSVSLIGFLWISVGLDGFRLGSNSSKWSIKSTIQIEQNAHRENESASAIERDAVHTAEMAERSFASCEPLVHVRRQDRGN